MPISGPTRPGAKLPVSRPGIAAESPAEKNRRAAQARGGASAATVQRLAQRQGASVTSRSGMRANTTALAAQPLSRRRAAIAAAASTFAPANEPASRVGAGTSWPNGRGLAIIGASGGIGTDLNTVFQGLATLPGSAGPDTIVTVARSQKPELKDPANPERTFFSTSLKPHADRVNDIFLTASVPMTKDADGMLDRAGMAKGNIGIVSSLLTDVPEGAVIFNATNPSHSLASMIHAIRPDVTPVGHAGTDYNRAVALSQVSLREGEPAPVIIGDHAASMGAWNGRGDFLIGVPDRGSMHAKNNRGQTMQSQTAQALISEAGRFHANLPTVLALPLTIGDAQELSTRLGMDVPPGLVSSFPMTAGHHVDWETVDRLLDDPSPQRTNAGWQSNRQIITRTVSDLIDQRQDMIDALHLRHDDLSSTRDELLESVNLSSSGETGGPERELTRVDREIAQLKTAIDTHPRRT